jgi:hypothetical protein
MTTSALGRCAVAQKLRHRPPFLLRKSVKDVHDLNALSWCQKVMTSIFFIFNFVKIDEKRAFSWNGKDPPLCSNYLLSVITLINLIKLF